MYPRKETVVVTTNSDGDATVYSGTITGAVLSVHYVKGDFADGVDFTVTSDATGQGIWTEENVNASTVRAPRQPTHGQDGVASLYAGSGLPVQDRIHLAADRVKFVIASGGDTKTGTFHVIYG